MISIIIPLYNKQDCILKTIESITTQDYEDYEIVVVDDGSTDDSVHIVDELHHPQIQLYQKQNGGPSSARNYGVQKACGEWVLFLDADDTLASGALKLAYDNICQHPGYDVYVYNLYMERAGKKSVRIKKHISGRVYFPFLSWTFCTSYPRTGNMVLKRKCMIEEPYSEDLRRFEDFENTSRLIRRYKFYADSHPLFVYNCDTWAASNPRKNIQEDYICTMEPKNASWQERQAMYVLYQEACRLYPNDAPQMYADYFSSLSFRVQKFLITHIYNKYIRFIL